MSFEGVSGHLKCSLMARETTSGRWTVIYKRNRSYDLPVLEFWACPIICEKEQQRFFYLRLLWWCVLMSHDIDLSSWAAFAHLIMLLQCYGWRIIDILECLRWLVEADRDWVAKVKSNVLLLWISLRLPCVCMHVSVYRCNFKK